jgi:ATP synthase protein I
MESNKDKKNNIQWLALINIPIQMGIIIFAFYKFGYWLDENYTSPKVYYYQIFTMIGVFLALYNVYRQVNEIGKNS